MPTPETRFSGYENLRAENLVAQFGLTGAVSDIASTLTRLVAT